MHKRGWSLTQLLQKLAASPTQALYECFMSKHVYIYWVTGLGRESRSICCHVTLFFPIRIHAVPFCPAHTLITSSNLHVGWGITVSFSPFYCYSSACSFFPVVLCQNKAVPHRWVDAQQTRKQLDVLESHTRLFCIATCALLCASFAGSFWRESSNRACNAKTATAMHTRSVWIKCPKTVLVSLSSLYWLLCENVLVWQYTKALFYTLVVFMKKWV